MREKLASTIERLARALANKLRGEQVVICGYCYSDHMVKGECYMPCPLRIYLNEIVDWEEDGHFIFSWSSK